MKYDKEKFDDGLRKWIYQQRQQGIKQTYISKQMGIKYGKLSQFVNERCRLKLEDQLQIAEKIKIDYDIICNL